MLSQHNKICCMSFLWCEWFIYKIWFFFLDKSFVVMILVYLTFLHYYVYIIINYIFFICIWCRVKKKKCILLYMYTNYLINFHVEMIMPWRFSFILIFMLLKYLINFDCFVHLYQSLNYNQIKFIYISIGKETIYYHKAERKVDRWRT
jgi:hypothetical protein